jgi:hypothetical protein
MAVAVEGEREPASLFPAYPDDGGKGNQECGYQYDDQ